MCSSDIFLGVLAIFFPPVAGKCPYVVQSWSESDLTLISPEIIQDRTQTNRRAPQYGSRKDYAPPTQSSTLPSVAWGIFPDSSMPGM